MADAQPDNTKTLMALKKYLLLFLDEIIEQFPYESDLVLARIFIKDQVPIEDIMIGMKERLATCKQMIIDRNEKFFLEDTSLFGNVAVEQVNHFKKLWSSDAIDDDDKEVIWQWIDTFVKLSEQYQYQ